MGLAQLLKNVFQRPKPKQNQIQTWLALSISLFLSLCFPRPTVFNFSLCFSFFSPFPVLWSFSFKWKLFLYPWWLSYLIDSISLYEWMVSGAGAGVCVRTEVYEKCLWLCMRVEGGYVCPCVCMCVCLCVCTIRVWGGVDSGWRPLVGGLKNSASWGGVVCVCDNEWE